MRRICALCIIAAMLDLSVPLLLAGGGGLSPLVSDIGMCLVASAVLSLIFVRVRLPVTAAFIFAGVLIGPIGMEMITDEESINTIANLGLTLLLFIIGLEINVKSLLASGKTLFITGLFQVPLTIGFGLVAFWGLTQIGLGNGNSEYTVLYLGLACAFSSTLLVVKTLQSRLQMDTVDGRLCIGLLIFQDIWAIVVLALVEEAGFCFSSASRFFVALPSATAFAREANMSELFVSETFICDGVCEEQLSKAV